MPADEVKKYFTETVPALKKRLRNQGRKFSTCKAELWTTGPLGTRARETLHALTSPETDEWKMLRTEEIHKLLPSAIKKRGAELLNAIAIEEAEGQDSEEA